LHEVIPDLDERAHCKEASTILKTAGYALFRDLAGQPLARVGSRGFGARRLPGLRASEHILLLHGCLASTKLQQL